MSINPYNFLSESSSPSLANGDDDGFSANNSYEFQEVDFEHKNPSLELIPVEKSEDQNIDVMSFEELFSLLESDYYAASRRIQELEPNDNFCSIFVQIFSDNNTNATVLPFKDKYLVENSGSIVTFFRNKTVRFEGPFAKQTALLLASYSMRCSDSQFGGWSNYFRLLSQFCSTQSDFLDLVNSPVSFEIIAINTHRLLNPTSITFSECLFEWMSTDPKVGFQANEFFRSLGYTWFASSKNKPQLLTENTLTKKEESIFHCVLQLFDPQVDEAGQTNVISTILHLEWDQSFAKAFVGFLGPLSSRGISIDLKRYEKYYTGNRFFENTSDVFNCESHVEILIGGNVGSSKLIAFLLTSYYLNIEDSCFGGWNKYIKILSKLLAKASVSDLNTTCCITIFSSSLIHSFKVIQINFANCLHEWMCKIIGESGDSFEKLLESCGLKPYWVNNQINIMRFSLPLDVVRPLPLEIVFTQHYLPTLPLNQHIQNEVIEIDDVDQMDVVESESVKTLSYYMEHEKDAVLKSYGQLINLLKSSWFSSAHLKGHLVQALTQSKGKWQLNFDSEESLRAFLQPLISFSEKRQKFEIMQEILKDVLSFFPISSPNAEIPILFRSIITSFDEQTTFFPLSEQLSLEVSQSFLNLKIAEFLLRANHLESFFQLETTEPKEIPCFLIEQDRNFVHADLMVAHFNERRSLIALSADQNQVAAHYLMEKDSSLQINTTATFSLDVLKNLQLSISQNKASSALFLQRVKITDAMALESLEPSVAKPKKEKSLINSLPKTTKRKREEDHGNQDSDIVNALTETKRQKNDDNNNSNHKRQSEHYASLRLKGAYVPFAESSLNTENVFQESNDPMEQIVPNISAVKKIAAFIPEKVLNLLNFWNETSLLALETVELKVAEQHAISEALKSKPLEYPISKSLQILEKTPVVANPTFNPLLKQYQKDEINKLLHFAKEKVSRILAFEMGLGKTFVFSEFICQMLAQKDGLILVVVPKSLLQSVPTEIKRAMTLSLAQAYRALGKTPKVLQGIAHEVQGILENGEKDRLAPMVQLFSLFDDAELKIELAERGCFEEKYAALWMFLKEELQKQVPILKEKTLLVKNVLSKSLTSSQELSKLPSRQSKRREQWENQLRKGLENTDEWLLNSSEMLLNQYAADLFFEECILIGRLLEISQGFENPHFPLDLLDRFSNFSTSKITSTKNLSELQETLLKKGSRVVITTHEILTKIDKTDLINASISSMIFDEAQKLHTDGTKYHEYYQQLTHDFPQKTRPAILFASGTPLENDFSELYTLLSLCNPHGFSAPTHNTLNILFDQAKKSLIAHSVKSDKNAFVENSVIQSFAQFEIFRRTISNFLVSRLTKTSPQVIEAWKDSIPTRTDHVIEGRISERAKHVLNKVEKDYRLSGSLFEYARVIKRVILDPALTIGKMSLKNPDIQKLIVDLKTPKYDPTELFNRSPLLSNLLSAKPMMEAMDNNESLIIVTEHRSAAKVLKLALQRKFSEFKPEVKVFHGDLSSGRREQKIRWFRKKETTNPKILILMAKAGGVGLNLPEGNKVFMANMDWNPSVDEQAIARVLRVGHPGNKQIYWIHYNIFFQFHQQAIQELKKAQEDFFFNPENQSVKNQFSKWCSVLESSCYHTFLNDSKSVSDASERRDKIREILSMLQREVESETLIETVANLHPAEKVFKVSDYSELSMQECVIIPTTIDGGSWIKTVAFGHALKVCVCEQPDAIRTVLKDFNTTFNKHPDWRQQIREGTFKDPTNQVNASLLKIKEKRPSEKASFLQTDYRIEFYKTASNGKLIRYHTTNPLRSEVIRLYQKSTPNGNHYDLIALL